MKSTEMIHDIVGRYGEDEKIKLNKDLKKLRQKIKQELLYHMRQSVKYAEKTYADDKYLLKNVDHEKQREFV